MNLYIWLWNEIIENFTHFIVHGSIEGAWKVAYDLQPIPAIPFPAYDAERTTRIPH